jgi:hypothetical protein
MVSGPTLGPGDVLDAFGSAAAVLSDHAGALDRLGDDREWDPDAIGDSGDRTGATDGRSAGPDGGGNGVGADLSRTLAAAVEGVDAVNGMASVADALASGARRVAKGQAGRGLVTLLESLAESLRNADRLDAERFAIGLELAAERLAPDDDGSHAGCLPAVVAAAADAALAAFDDGADLGDVVIAAADDGLAELESGPLANPELVERGVVDAPAAGFLLVLDVLASVITGEPLPAPPAEPTGPPAALVGSVPTYRVSCRLEPAEGVGIESADWLEALWRELGRLDRYEAFGPAWEMSLVTSDPGRAVEALFGLGRPTELRIAVVPGPG